MGLCGSHSNLLSTSQSQALFSYRRQPQSPAHNHCNSDSINHRPLLLQFLDPLPTAASPKLQPQIATSAVQPRLSFPNFCRRLSACVQPKSKILKFWFQRLPVSVKMDASKSFEEIPYADIKSFFDSAPPLKDAAEIKRKLEGFMGKNHAPSENGKANRVVCVTSGGTTVPLEQRCVRYIDNFSSGHRGAASTEYFLKAGYAVVFLHRRGTCQPYCRSLPDDPLLECFEVTNESNITVNPMHAKIVKRAIRDNRGAVIRGALLKLPFTTIFEYLQILQLIALSMRSLGSSALFYLAAAVSDFYVPWESMAMHKIQSSSGPLDMRLVQVPKMLSVLRKGWAPTAFCISFKLETDIKILLEKADMALKKYNMHMVVANELLTRKEEVIVVSESGNITVHRDKTQPDADVEEPLINLIVDRHSAYISSDS